MPNYKGEWEKTKYPCIEKREEDGKYRVTLDYGVITAYSEKKGRIETRRVKTRKVVDTLKEARELKASERIAKNNGTSLKAGTQKLKDVLKLYWEKKGGDFAESSVSSKQHHLRLINEFFGETEVRYISKNKIEDFCEYMYRKKGFGRNSIIKVKSSLSCVFNFMLGDPNVYGITQNPCLLKDLDLKAPELKRGDAKFFEAQTMTKEEVNITINDILMYEDDRALLAIFALATIGGLRRSEIAGLTKGAFYATDNRMFIKDVVIKDRHCRNANKSCTKNGSYRYVARPKILTDVIEYCLQQSASLQGYKSIKDIPDTDRIVRPVRELVTGKATCVDKLYERWKDYQNRRNRRLENIGKEPIKLVRLHDLRHTHAHLLVSELPTYLISRNMGHSTFNGFGANTTEKVYLQDDDDRSAINDFFNNKETCPIKIDWEKRNKLVLTASNTSIDGSGHLKIN